MPRLRYSDLSLPDKCLVHRYLYYVLGDPIVSDRDYDMMERDAVAELEANVSLPDPDMDDLDHPLLRPGSDRPTDYPQRIRDLAAFREAGKQMC